MSTSFKSKEQAEADRKWLVVNAQDQTLGRLASQVAHILRGKHKPDFTAHVDGGDFVVVINAEKIKLTGNKLSDKIYYKHTGYLGHMKATSASDMLEKHPDRLITEAVKGMLPKGPLGRHMAKKLKVYAGDQHPHAAQRPQNLEISNSI